MKKKVMKKVILAIFMILLVYVRNSEYDEHKMRQNRLDMMRESSWAGNLGICEESVAMTTF
jgi:hypothetical protein